MEDTFYWQNLKEAEREFKHRIFQNSDTIIQGRVWMDGDHIEYKVNI